MTDACKVEHNLSDEAFENIKSHAAGENKKRNFACCDGRPGRRPGPVPFGSSGRGGGPTRLKIVNRGVKRNEKWGKKG